MEPQFERRPWLLPVVLYALALLLLRPAILPFQPDFALSGNDFTGNVYPLYEYTFEMVRRGELPLWNPRQFAGFPVAGNPQAAIFYPPTWAVWGLAGLGVSIPRAIGLMVIGHVGLAAWGMAALSRYFGASYTGALAAGVIYAMSGWAGARVYAGHYTILTTYAWLSWVLVAYAHALDNRRWLALVPAAGALGIMALAGHPQMVLYAMLGAGALWLYRVIINETDALRQAWDGAWRLGLIALGGVILGAALVIPTAELTGYSVRTTLTLEQVNGFALLPSQLMTMILPFLYGNPLQKPSYYWGAPTFEEMNAYVGLLPLVLLLLTLRLRDRRMLFWVGLVVGGTVLSLGAAGVLFELMVRWIPGFSLFRAPGRFLFFVMFGLAGLTGQWITALQAATPHRRRVMLSPALRAVPYAAAVLLAGSVFFSGWFASASHVEPMPHRAQLVADVLGYSGVVLLGVWGVLALLTDANRRRFRAGLVCALLLITWDAWRAVTPIMAVGDVTHSPLWDGAEISIPTGADARLRAFPDPNDYFRSPVNTASRTGHLHIEGYDPLEIGSYTRLVEPVRYDSDSPVYDLLGVKYILAWEPREDAGYELIGVNEGSIVYENTDPFPRAWVTVDGRLQPDDDATRQQIINGEIDLRETVILAEPLDCELGDTPATPAVAAITEYRPNDIIVNVESDGGVLVLSDQYYPGWVAQVDGERVPIARAYTSFRAVCVPPGEHTVTFRYRPRSVMWGAGLSGVGWLVWAGAMVIWRRPR
jgi:hypothetical protein